MPWETLIQSNWFEQSHEHSDKYLEVVLLEKQLQIGHKSLTSNFLWLIQMQFYISFNCLSCIVNTQKIINKMKFALYDHFFFNLKIPV